MGQTKNWRGFNKVEDDTVQKHISFSGKVIKKD